MDNQLDPHQHAAANLRAMTSKAVETGLSYIDQATGQGSWKATPEDHKRAERLVIEAWHALWLRHLSDMMRRYGTAYGPWPVRDRSRAARRGKARYGPRRRFRV